MRCRSILTGTLFNRRTGGLFVGKLSLSVEGPRPCILLIIPTKNQPLLASRLLASDLLVDYRALLIDNGSSTENRLEYLKICQSEDATHRTCDIPFNFSKLCNFGAEGASAEVLIFLNDDTELLDQDSLQKLAETALQPGVGAVGARLLYGDRKTIQHAGVCLIRNGPSHTLTHRKDHPRRYGGWLRGVYPVSAVTAACLAISRKNFEAVGGFDENLPVAYNDVDLCLRLNTMGLQTVVRNDVRLIHHESMSRGNDLVDRNKREALARALKYLRDRHGRLWPDPFYPEGLDQHRPDFRVDWKAAVHPVGYTLKGWTEPALSGPTGRQGDLAWGVEEWSLDDRVLKLEGWALDRQAGSAGVRVEVLGFEDGRVRAYPCHRYPRIDAELECDAWFLGDRAGFYLNATFSKRAWARTQRWALRVATPSGEVLCPFQP